MSECIDITGKTVTVPLGLFLNLIDNTKECFNYSAAYRLNKSGEIERSALQQEIDDCEKIIKSGDILKTLKNVTLSQGGKSIKELEFNDQPLVNRLYNQD